MLRINQTKGMLGHDAWIMVCCQLYEQVGLTICRLTNGSKLHQVAQVLLLKLSGICT